MRVPLGTSDYSRSLAETPAIAVYNRFFESDPTNQTDQVDLLSRPALRKWLTLDTSCPRGIYSQPGTFGEALFVVSGDTLYRIDPNEAVTAIGTLGGAQGSVSMAATDTYLFIADGTGLWYYTDDGYATGTLTASGTITSGEKVVVGSVTYQFTSGSVDAGAPDGGSGNPWLVAVGASTAQALQHLYDAIGNTGEAGTDYSTLLTANGDATPMSVTATVLKVRAAFNGTGGNSVATTETGANVAWGGTVLSGGGGASFAQIAVPDDVGIVSVGVIASYAICVTTQGYGVNGRFYWIEPGEITIDPLNFATAERSPDPVWNVVVVGDQFWLPGSSTTEVWYASGEALAPFQRQQGRLFDKGVWEGTVLQVKDAVMAVGTDGTVYRIEAEPVVVSNCGIAQRLREAINTQRSAEHATTFGDTASVSLDFANNTYKIAGVTKTLSDVLEQNVTWGSYSSSDVVPGAGINGLKVQQTGSTGEKNSAPALTAAAIAAIGSSFTAVATVSVAIGVGAGQATVGFELDNSGITAGWGCQVSWSGAGNASSLYDLSGLNAPLALGTSGEHKIALTLSPSRLAASVDGSAVTVTSAPQSITPGFVGLYVDARVDSGTGPVTAVIERIEFFPVQGDLTLPLLSV